MQRTVGIEEELLLVDTGSGRALSVAGSVLRHTASEDQLARAGVTDTRGPGGHVTSELQQQQLETDTPPRAALAELDDDLRRWRDLTIRSAREVGAGVVASGTAPLPVTPQPQRSPRYREMSERFGITSAEHLTCGCHVHVSVASDEEGVGVLDRIRTWLAPLLAISANSPYWQGEDSGYASFRSQAIVRWPSAGPADVFGSARAYRRLVDDMVGTGVLLDPAMAYFDARLAQDYPTVEIRVADVCLDTRDAVLVAGLCRALVDTAAREWADGEPAPEVPTALLRLASWQAGRDGTAGQLLDPVSFRPRPAAEVLAALVEHVGPALEANGDRDLVDERLARVLAHGTGAARQRRVLERTGQLTDVVAELVRVTAGRGD